MAKVIKVSRKEYRGSDVQDIDDYVGVLNGIAYNCQNYAEFSHGSRNTVAVDLTVASFIVGLKAEVVLDWFVVAGLIDLSNDDENTYHRIETVLDYSDRFCWDYMIDPEQYLNCPTDQLPLVFEVVD